MATLETLKEENARLEAEAAESTQDEVVDTEEIAEETELEDAEVNDQGGGSENETDDGAGEEESEDWMQADEQTSDSNETVPVAAHAKMRAKLKGKVGERDATIETLMAENAALKSGQPVVQSPQTTQQPVKAAPTLEQHEFDEGKYQQAMAEWASGLVDAKLSASNQANTQNTKQKQALAAQNTEVEAHYTRAAKLASETNITSEMYQQTDLTVRQALESVMPDQGDAVTDSLIARLGDGSEKVMYYLGRNTQARENLKAKLISDPSGISAAMYMGELKNNVAAPQKRVSRAPAPATTITGDESSNVTDSKKLLAVYNKAHKSGNAQLAYDTKLKARSQGVDTSIWT